jgi:hypothetical protein
VDMKATLGTELPVVNQQRLTKRRAGVASFSERSSSELRK